MKLKVSANATQAPETTLTTNDSRSTKRSWSRLVVTLGARAIVRPRVAVDLVRVAWRFRRRGWYTRPPFLPLPARDYVRWRMYTAYGDYDAVPPAEDVIRYARWVGTPP